MKKSLLLILASLLAVFAITGCSDDSSDDTPAAPTTPVVVPIDPSNTDNLSQLLGNYEILFFYTNGANALSIASDCTKVEYYTGKADPKCVQGTNNVDMKGYGTVELTNNNINIITKMQMTNSNLQNPTDLWVSAKNNQYNYTVFTPIPVDAISDNAINNGTNAVKGTTGRNLIQNTNNSNDTYKFELLSDGTIRNTMTDTSVPNFTANVTVIMKKIDTRPQGYNMNKDEKFPEPNIEGFVENISSN